MLTEKDYCDYETSRELKELGFVAGLGEDDCGHCLYDDAWHDQVNRPLLYEAQKWLREEKDIDVLIKLECKDVYSSLKHYSVYLSYIGSFIRRFQYLLDEFNSYEEALSEGIKIAVKILKEKLNEET